MLTPYQIKNSSIAQKHSRIYGYAPEDHFADIAKEHRATLALARVQREAAHQPHIALTHNTRQIVEFLKNRLLTGNVYSVPLAQFEAVQDGSTVEVPAHWGPNAMVPLFKKA